MRLGGKKSVKSSKCATNSIGLKSRRFDDIKYDTDRGFATKSKRMSESQIVENQKVSGATYISDVVLFPQFPRHMNPNTRY